MKSPVITLPLDWSQRAILGAHCHAGLHHRRDGSLIRQGWGRQKQCMLLVRCTWNSEIPMFFLLILMFIHFLNLRNSEIPRLFFLLISVFSSEQWDLWCFCSYVFFVISGYFLGDASVSALSCFGSEGAQEWALFWNGCFSGKNMAINADYCNGDELWLMVNFNNRTIHGYIRCSYPVSSNVAAWEFQERNGGLQLGKPSS